MPASEPVDRLIRLLESEADSLEKLRAAMEKSRGAWLALRPSELQSSVAQLQEMAEHSAGAENQRREVVRELAEELGLPESATVSRLSSRLSSSQATRLRVAAGRASRAAYAVRRESGMGTRLLDFSRQSQESMIHSLRRLSDGEARSYDRNAQAVVQAASVGSFVDGRL